MIRENFRCKRCEALDDRRFAERLARGETRKPFAAFGAIPHYAPDRPFRARALTLEVELDPKVKRVSGKATHELETVASGQSRVRFDQVGLEFSSVTVDGRQTSFEVEDGSIWVDLPGRTPEPGTKLTIVIDYSARDPKRGLYFIHPTREQPKKRYEVWSQGQDEDNRHWIPLLDYPNEKTRTEVIATVPKGFTVISNGALIESRESGSRTTVHHRLATPHVTYLLSLVVGEYAGWKDEGPRGLPVEYFVEKGREADGRRAFGNTPKMIEAFERRTGVPYPYEKYSQVAVQDFIFGGMENTSATTQTDRVLHDEKAHVDYSGDPLVSHELAHQWFGDLLTCRDWSHGWLNEGFATFMERVWVEENIAEYGSRANAFEEAKYYSYADWQEYSAEDANHYRRPIVCNTYAEPIDLFDAHLYQKGGLVLNLLRAQLGEDAFWRVIRHYLEKHRGGSVETLDLIRAIEEVTGRNFRRFFDQWVFGAGFPELEISYAYHEDKKCVELTVEQKQTGGQPELWKDGARTSLFELDVPIVFRLAGGKTERVTFALRSARDRMFFSVSSRPVAVRFDPDATIPKRMKFPRPKELLLEQLVNDPDCMGRIEAALELSKLMDASVCDALAERLMKDPFWGVQAEIAAVLGAHSAREAAQAALVAAVKLPHPKARRAVAQALANVRTVESERALKSLAEKDASYFVEARAVRSWAAVRSSPYVVDRPEAVADTERQLLSWLSRESFSDVLRGAVYSCLATLPGVARGDRPKSLEALLEGMRPERSEDVRAAALGALCEVLKTASPAVRERVLQTFHETAGEPSFRLRMRLAVALGDTGLPQAIPILARIHALEVDGRVKRTALVMMDHLRESGGVPETVTQLKTEVDRLREEQAKLLARVEKLAGEAKPQPKALPKAQRKAAQTRSSPRKKPARKARR